MTFLFPTCVRWWWACVQSESLIPASGSRSALYRVNTFPHSHRAQRVSLHHPPSPPPAPQRVNHCPPATKHVSVWHPWLSQRALWLAESVRTSSQTQTHTFKWRCGTINRREEPAQIRLSLQRLHSTHIQPWHLQSLQLSPVLRSIWLWATRWDEDPRTFKYG